MADYSNIPTGLKINSQIPLNVKEFCKDEATLAYLGVDDNLAFTYHDGIEILCIEEKTLYKWKEVQAGEENTGLVPLDYTYPNGLPDTFGINYSGKTYNFFLVEYITVENINKNINITNTGEGVEIYKGYNSTIDEHEFRTVVQEDQGTGESFLRDIQQTTDELKVRVKTLVSDNLTITSTDEEVRIETPMTASIPALYVNNLYVPTYQEWLAENSAQNSGTPIVGFQFIGRGTLSAPFTDTIVYTLNAPLTPPVITANTAIQNALDGDTIYSYVGSGTRLNPNKLGQRIIIQNNSVGYTFPGDFNYQDIYLEIGSNIDSTTTGFLIDMENSFSFDQTTSKATINIVEDYVLTISGDGFNNNGNTEVTNTFITGKSINLLGTGTIYSTTNNITKYILNSDVSNTGNNNDGNLTFRVECILRADLQGIYKVGGNSRVDFFNTLQSGTITNIVDLNLKAFHQTGGQVRCFNTNVIQLFGTNRNNGLTFEPTLTFIPSFFGLANKFVGVAKTLFNKENNNNTNLQITNSESAYDLNVINIFGSTNLWSVIFRDNTFATGSIDFTITDLTNINTISSINTIGNNVVETLVVYNNRADAILAGVPLYSVYLKTSGVAYPTTTGWVRDIVLPS